MKWINVEKELPSKDTQIIGYVKGHHCPIQMLGYGIPENTWYCWVEAKDVPDYYEVTHWMPMPKPPKD